MNCIIIDDDPIIQKQLTVFINKCDLLNFKGAFKNPLEATSIFKNEEIDIIFLDIEMPEMSGLEFLDESDDDIRIIVISGDRRYALNTFDYDVTDYLLKPIEYPRFLKSVYKSIEKTFQLYDKEKTDRIFIRQNNKYFRLKVNDIISVMKQNDEDCIVTKSKSIILPDGHFNIECIYNNSNFYKINNTCFVNLNEIECVCDNFLIFKDSEKMEKICVEANVANEISEKINK